MKKTHSLRTHLRSLRLKANYFLTKFKIWRTASLVSVNDKFIRCGRAEAKEFIAAITFLIQHQYVFSQSDLVYVQKNFSHVKASLEEQLHYYKNGSPGYKKILHLSEKLEEVQQAFYHPCQSEYAV